MRVWAPNANAVNVVGSWDGWDPERHPMGAADGGTWSTDVSGAKPGDEYRFLIVHGRDELWRIDPRARRLTTSVGNSVV